MKPKILLTNDDGITSTGLWAAYDALAPIADVTVVAPPATQQSAVGRSISIFEPIRATKVTMNGVTAYSVGGKPTDAVIIGLFALRLNPPDLVVSGGVNIGENLSFESIMTSGTVGAALEASNQGGVPSLAFSLQVEDQGDKFDDPPSRITDRYFDTKRVVREICERVLANGFPPGKAHVINVNIPAQVRGGYEITRLAEKLFYTGVEERLDPRGRPPYYWIDGPLYEDAEEGDRRARGAEGVTSPSRRSRSTARRMPPRTNSGASSTACISEREGEEYSMSTAEQAVSKRNAGHRAAEEVADGMVVGLGTGSTVFFAMERLGKRIAEDGLSIAGVPTSYQAAIRARRYGIPPLTSLDEHPPELDIAIDGGRPGRSGSPPDQGGAEPRFCGRSASATRRGGRSSSSMGQRWWRPWTRPCRSRCSRSPWRQSPAGSRRSVPIRSSGKG